MKTIVVISSYSPSLINFRGDLIKKFLSYGYNVICVAPDEDPKVKEILSEYGAQFKRIDFIRNKVSPIQDLFLLFKLVLFFLKVRPEVVISYTVKPVIYGSIASFVTGVKKRVSLVTGLGYSFSKSKTSFLNSMLRLCAQFLYKTGVNCSTHVLFQNKDDKNELLRRKFLKHAKAYVTNGSGVNMEHFSPQKTESIKPIKFLMIARLIKDKGVYDFISAAMHLKSLYREDVEFHLVGWSDGEEGAINKELIDEWVNDGIIIYHGKLNDVRPILTQCHVFILPSYYPEGTPRTILEAMALAKPIITTDSVGCRETVINGYNGFLVGIKSPQQIIDKAKYLVENHNDIVLMGQNSLALVKEKYDVHLVNDQIINYTGIKNRCV